MCASFRFTIVRRHDPVAATARATFGPDSRPPRKLSRSTETACVLAKEPISQRSRCFSWRQNLPQIWPVTDRRCVEPGCERWRKLVAPDRQIDVRAADRLQHLGVFALDDARSALRLVYERWRVTCAVQRRSGAFIDGWRGHAASPRFHFGNGSGRVFHSFNGSTRALGSPTRQASSAARMAVSSMSEPMKTISCRRSP